MVWLYQLRDGESAVKKALVKGDSVHMSMGVAVSSTLQDWMRASSEGHITSLGVHSQGHPTFRILHCIVALHI